MTPSRDVMAFTRLRLGALLVLFGGLALLSGSAMLVVIVFLGFFFFASPPVWAAFVAVVLFLGGLTVAVLGAGIFLLGLANQSS